MYSMATDWNPKQQKLRESLSNNGDFQEAKRICLELHGIVHTSMVSFGTAKTYMDEIWEGLSRESLSVPLESKNGFGRKATIAWDIWHITRIEDLTTNILIADSKQILNENWLKRLEVTITETGNSMSDAQIQDFSHSINPMVLREYRDAVGSQTRNVVSNLTQKDVRRKFAKESLGRILREGGVTEDKNSIWLLDFWGRKNVAGILLMPVTRHQIVHLNECARIKDKLKKKGNLGQ